MAWVDVNNRDDIGGDTIKGAFSPTKTINYGTQGIPSWMAVVGLIVAAVLIMRRRRA